LASRYLQGAEGHSDVLVWMERVLFSILPTALGMVLILLSWLTDDARTHGKPPSWVVTTGVLSWFSLGLAMFGYLFLTRVGLPRWIALTHFALLLLLLVLAQTTGLTLSTH
jgi:cell division protein FtsW (lipid II flippase)